MEGQIEMDLNKFESKIWEKFCGGYPSTKVHDLEPNQSEGEQEFRIRCYNEVLTIKEFCMSLPPCFAPCTPLCSACARTPLC